MTADQPPRRDRPDPLSQHPDDDAEIAAEVAVGAFMLAAYFADRAVTLGALTGHLDDLALDKALIDRMLDSGRLVGRDLRGRERRVASVEARPSLEVRLSGDPRLVRHGRGGAEW